MGRKARYDYYPPGEIIKAALEKRKITQRELAEIINSSAPTVNDIITGKRGITENLCVRISLALALDPFELARAYSDHAIKMELKRFMAHISKDANDEN